MSIRSRPGRPLMEPDADVLPFDWSRDGTTFLWLVALNLAVVVWISLLSRS